nr:stalk domain-containing protein [Paenibacillus periandrae]
MSPIILDGTSYVPAKAVVEVMGGELKWDDRTQTISITTDGSISEKDQAILEKINEIKSKLKLGLTKNEVSALFTEKFESAQNSDSENGSDSYWKYEYLKVPDYNREDHFPDHADHVIDQQALLNKKIGAYIYIEWRDNKLHMYSISYVNPKDKHVYLYSLSPDGSTSDDRVT